MILQSLVRFYETLEKKGEIVPLGSSLAKVSVAAVLSRSGELLQLTPLTQPVVMDSKTIDRPQTLRVPEQITRSNGICAQFLCDTPAYILGIDPSAKKPERVPKCFDASRERHEELLSKVGNPMAEAILAFYRSWEKDPENPIVKDRQALLDIGGNIVFRVEGLGFAHEDEEILRAFQKSISPAEDGEEAAVMPCLITGKFAPATRLHAKIKGVRGAKSSGASLVSFNAPCLNSFGREQGYNAPISKYASFAFTAALNYLLADFKHRTQWGDATVVYWTEDDDEAIQECMTCAINPDDDQKEKLHDMMHALAKQEPIIDGVSMNTPFYVLGLSPNSARVSVRFFLQGTMGEFLAHLQEHYALLEIVRTPLDKEYLLPRDLMKEILNAYGSNEKDIQTLIPGLIKSILMGTPYPEGLDQAALRRIKVEKDNKDKYIYRVTRGRIAIVKAYLMRNKGEEITVELDVNNKQEAYVLGRLFSLLEEIQQASGGATTIKDRYYASAMTTPASVFPILFRLSAAHARKMEIGQRIYYEKQMNELMGMLQSQYISRILSMPDQNLFVIGYYHQNQARYDKKDKREIIETEDK